MTFYIKSLAIRTLIKYTNRSLVYDKINTLKIAASNKFFPKTQALS